MKRETAKRLLDARNACLEIQHFAAGRSQDAIMTDRGLQLILQTLLVTIGEALSQVRQADPETANLIPDIHRAIGMRHQILLATIPSTIPLFEGIHDGCAEARHRA